MIRTILDQWLKALPGSKGAVIQTNEQGVAHLQVDEDFTLSIGVNEDTRMLGLVGVLMPAPAPDEGKLLYEILSANLPILILRQASMCIDAEAGQLMLARYARSDDLDAGRFAQFLSETTQIATAIRSTIGTLRQDAAAPAQGATREDVGATWLKT